MAVAKKRGLLIGMGSEGLETGGEPGDYPYSPRCDLGRMFLGAIGSFGIITRITPKLKYSLDKIEFLYATGNNLYDLLSKVRKTTMSTDAAEVALIGDSKTISSYLSKSKNIYDNFVNKLPDWTAIFAIGGEQELVNVEKKDLMEYGIKNGLPLTNTPPVSGMNEILEREFRVPENVASSFDYSPHLRIEFYTTAGNIEKIQKEMQIFFSLNKIGEKNIGLLTNSIEMGRTYFCEYDLYYEPIAGEINIADLPNIGNLNLIELYEASYKKIIKLGGVLNIPRNTITAKLMYPLNPNYYELLRVLKYSLDPKNLMHPQAIFSGEGGINPKTIQIQKVV